MKGDAQATGRILVSFPPGELSQAASRLHDLVGVSPGDVADARTFTRGLSKDVVPAFAIDELGVLCLDDAQVEGSRLLRRELPGVLRRARPEMFIRRAHTERDAMPPADALVATAALRQTRALDAIGLQLDQAEGNGVLVAVLDTGIKPLPDLRQAIQDHPPVSFVPGQSSTDDGVGHGTHCAGLIAGPQAPAGGRRYGVAPRARLIVVRVFDDLERSPETDVLEAVYWAARAGAHIISLSGGRDAGGTILAEDEDLGRWLLARNVLFLCAAGNTSDRLNGRAVPVESPANAPGIVAVGAATRSKRLWNSSNGTPGPSPSRVDFVAPGVGVPSIDLDGTLTRARGTSVSTAIAAGVAAVLKGRDPNLTAAGLMERMRVQTRPLVGNPPAAGVGAGLIQVNP